MRAALASAMTHADEPVDEPVLALVRDLTFSSRITGAGKRLGVPVRVLRDSSLLTPATAGRCVIADVDLPGATEAAAAWAGATGRPASGFAQHVHTEAIRAARAAGLSPVVMRSGFDAALPGLLSDVDSRDR